MVDAMSPCTTWPTFCSSDIRAISAVIFASIAGSSAIGDACAGHSAEWATPAGPCAEAAPAATTPHKAATPTAVRIGRNVTVRFKIFPMSPYPWRIVIVVRQTAAHC
ncbi:hypothetical protein GCM10011404_12780 [Sphingomonas prati]|nr:hypothetical protein GCM10011404_12780 [Sphingomonas prati]